MTPLIYYNCYLDSGAKNHTSGDIRSFTNCLEYNECDQVQSGYGDFLPITHTDSIFQLCGFNSFNLSKVLRVPSIRKKSPIHCSVYL